MPETRRDFYDVLGVARDADAKAIKERFRELAKTYHPDRNRSPEAEAKFKEIAQAYAVLSDPDKRRQYDAGGFAATDGFSQEDLYGGLDFSDILSGLGLGLGGPSFFDGLFGRRRPSGPPRGSDIELAVPLSLLRVLEGGMEAVRYQRARPCSACGGSGAKPGTEPRPCSGCQGSGKKAVSSRRGNTLFQSISVCDVCHGRGQLIEHPCPTCAGHGQQLATEEVKVRIPKGAPDGLVLRVAGHGMAPPVSGGAPGDLLVVVQTEPDPRFERRGADLFRVETLSIADAVLGTTLDVDTLDGSGEGQRATRRRARHRAARARQGPTRPGRERPRRSLPGGAGGHPQAAVTRGNPAVRGAAQAGKALTLTGAGVDLAGVR